MDQIDLSLELRTRLFCRGHFSGSEQDLRRRVSPKHPLSSAYACLRQHQKNENDAMNAAGLNKELRD